MGSLSLGRVFWIVASTLLIAGPLLGIGVYRVVAMNEEAATHRRFDELVGESAYLLEKQMTVLSEVLSSVSAFFDSSEYISRDEFSEFTRDALERHAVIRALEWIPAVPLNSRPSHESHARSQGLGSYRIWGIDEPARPAADDLLGAHFPVYYIEPLVGNEAALGLDLATEPTRAAAIARALECDEVVLSDPIDLVQGDGESPGILAMRRVRNDPGLALLVFEVRSLVAIALRAHPIHDLAAYDFELIDVNASAGPQTIHRHDNGDPASDPDRWRTVRNIATGGKTWRLTAVPTRAFLERDLRIAGFVGAGSAVVWELMWLALISVAALSRSRTLRRKDLLTHSVLSSMNEGVVVADDAGRIVMINQAGMNQLQASGPDDVTPKFLHADGRTPCEERDGPMRRVLSGDLLENETYCVHNDRDKSWLTINGTPLADDKGEVSGGLIVMRDISASKDADEVVGKLFNAVEHTDDPVFITNRRGRIDYVNPAFERVTGFSKDEAVGFTPRILKSGLHAPEEYEEMWTTILGGDVYRRTITNRRKNGETYESDQTITPMRDMTGRITDFVTVSKDMTDFLTLKERELNMTIAANVQQRLYPEAAPLIDGLDVAGAVFPAEMTCGDYYDFIETPDGQLGIVVGDVSGHGVGAAMVMMETRALLRSLLDSGLAVDMVFSRINQYLYDDFDSGSFVTMIYASVHPATGRLSYVSAGHDTCYVIDRRGDLKFEMVSTGLPLGLIEGGGYRHAVGPALEEGDVAVLLTDGLTECQAPKGRFLERDTCLDTVAAHRHESASVILESLHALVQGFSGDDPQNDDITIVVFKAGEKGAKRKAEAVAEAVPTA